MPTQETLRFIGLALLWSRRKWILQADSDKVEHAKVLFLDEEGARGSYKRRAQLPHKVPGALGRMMKT